MKVQQPINSVKLCGPLCLCGEIPCEQIHHRGTENSQSFTEKSIRIFLKQYGLILVMVCGLLFSSFGFALAKEAQPNEDPQLEQRMKHLTEQLRCLVCQNETLADSRADLAEDLRKQIREQIRAGKTDQ